MRISKKSEYGLRAMIYLAGKNKKPCPLKEISEKEKLPIDFLEKIFSKLKEKKLVKAKKGIQGGYFLAKSPEKIKISQIIESLGEKTTLVECLENFCQRAKNCRAKTFWKKLKKTMDLLLNSVTLFDLIKGK